MAIKKSELYSSLWASCDKLRGSMEPIQYKDYVLVMVFIKYISDKWMASIERSVKTEMECISQRLTQRIKELAERYETPLPIQTSEVAELEAEVSAHLQKMGFVWS